MWVGKGGPPALSQASERLTDTALVSGVPSAGKILYTLDVKHNGK